MNLALGRRCVKTWPRIRRRSTPTGIGGDDRKGATVAHAFRESVDRSPRQRGAAAAADRARSRADDAPGGGPPDRHVDRRRPTAVRRTHRRRPGHRTPGAAAHRPGPARRGALGSRARRDRARSGLRAHARGGRHGRPVRKATGARPPRGRRRPGLLRSTCDRRRSRPQHAAEGAAAHYATSGS